jgi:hypothetical protein
MADVQPAAGAGAGGANPPAGQSQSPDRSQGGGSQASITPPTAPPGAAPNANNNNNNANQALAQAQMSTLGSRTGGTGGGGTRRRDPAQDEAIMGVAESGAYEALDEGGEMVRVRFLDFLQTL